jgi:hypothetical protein
MHTKPSKNSQPTVAKPLVQASTGKQPQRPQPLELKAVEQVSGGRRYGGAPVSGW